MRMSAFVEWFVRFMVLVRHLDARRGHWIGTGEAALADQSFSLPGVGLILDPVFVPGDHTVESTRLLGVTWPWAEAGSHRYLVLGCDLGLEPIKRVSRTARREVVSVY